MNKQTKILSSITLGLALLFITPAGGQEAASIDSFENFIVRPGTPLVDSVSVYRLTFNLSPEVYGNLDESRLNFDFPESFGLNSVDSVSFVSGPLERIYRVDKFRVEGQTVEIRLKKAGGDGDDGNSDDDDEVDGNLGTEIQRVVMEVGLFRVVNPRVGGLYQITGTVFKGDKIIAGPSLSELFEIIENQPGPKAELQIVFTELISANSPKVNTNQIFTILSKIVNKSSFASPPVVIELLSDGQSSFQPQKEVGIIAGGAIAHVAFEVTAASEPGTENFETNIVSHKVLELEPIDNQAKAIIQSPALLKLISSVEDGATVNLPNDEPFAVAFELANLGEAAVGRGHYILTIVGNEINNKPIVREGEIAVGHPIQYEYSSTRSGRAVVVNFKVDRAPIDSNNLQPAPIIDNTIEFTIIEKPVFQRKCADSLIVESNPFNPLDGPVTFLYNLCVDSDVEFRVFTITGEKVYSDKFTLGSQGGMSGTNQILWDGRNDTGDMVLNGVYVTMLNVLATGETTSLKLAVLK